MDVYLAAVLDPYFVHGEKKKRNIFILTLCWYNTSEDLSLKTLIVKC